MLVVTYDTSGEPMDRLQNPPGESSTIVKTIILALSILISVISMATLPIELGLVLSVVSLTIGFGMYSNDYLRPVFSTLWSPDNWYSRVGTTVVHPGPTTNYVHVSSGLAQTDYRHSTGPNSPIRHTSPMGNIRQVQQRERHPVAREHQSTNYVCVSSELAQTDYRHSTGPNSPIRHTSPMGNIRQVQQRGRHPVGGGRPPTNTYTPLHVAQGQVGPPPQRRDVRLANIYQAQQRERHPVAREHQ